MSFIWSNMVGDNSYSLSRLVWDRDVVVIAVVKQIMQTWLLRTFCLPWMNTNMEKVKEFVHYVNNRLLAHFRVTTSITYLWNSVNTTIYANTSKQGSWPYVFFFNFQIATICQKKGEGTATFNEEYTCLTADLYI